MALSKKENCANIPVKNILIVGETGVGKSTWINGIANYFYFDSFDDACKGDIQVHIPACFYQFNQKMNIGKESKNENLNQVGESATQKPKTYSLTIDSKMYINLIDTPGIGGFSLTEKDKENVDKILAHISGLKNLDAICILLKPNSSRLTLTFRYCIQQLLLRLHISVKNNILFCFTHSRCSMYGPGDTFLILNEELAKMDIEMKAIYSEENRFDATNNCFCFDNEAFRYLVCVKNEKKVSPDIHKTYAESWNQAKNETIALFIKVNNLVPYAVADTISVTQSQNLIIALIRPIGQCLNIYTEYIYDIQKINEQIKVTKLEISDIENNFFNSNSLVLSYANGSAYNTYRHITYATKVAKGEDAEKLTLQSYYSNVLRDKKSNLDQLENLKIQTTNRVEELGEEINFILQTTAMFGAYLKKNALIACNDVFDEFFKMMIKEEDKKFGFLKVLKIKNLKKFLNLYERRKNNFLDATTNESIKVNISAETINKLKIELINLRHMGKIFKTALTSAMSSLEKKQNESRKHVIGKIGNFFCSVIRNSHNDRDNQRTNNICCKNEAYDFLECGMTDNAFPLKSQITYEESWSQSRSDMLALFKTMDLLVPYNGTNKTKENQARRIAIALIKPIEECLSVITDNIKIAANFNNKSELQNIETDNIAHAVKVNVVSLSINSLDYPVTVCTHKDCIEFVSAGISQITNINFKTICHNCCLLKDIPTQVTNNPKVAYCDAFCYGPKCKKCRHTYDVHMLITYTVTKEVKEFISKDAQKLIMAKSSKREQIKELKAEIQKKVKELEEEKDTISKAAIKFRSYLVQNALDAYCDAFAKYIDMNMIKKEDKNSMFMYDSKLQIYHEKQIQSIKNALEIDSNRSIHAEDIIILQDQLIQLKHMGKTLKDVLTSVMNCFKKTQNLNQQGDIGKNENHTNTLVSNINGDGKYERDRIFHNGEAYLEGVMNEKAFPLKIQNRQLSLALFKMTDSHVSYNDADAFRANQTRMMAMIISMEECLKVINFNIKTVNYNLKIQKKIVNIHNAVKFKTILLFTKSLIYPVTLRTNIDCTRYASVCKPQPNGKNYDNILKNHCLLKDVPKQAANNSKSAYCDAFSNGQNSNRCDNTYDSHMYIEYTATDHVEEFLSKDAQRKIKARKSKGEQFEELKMQTLIKYIELEEEKETFLKANVKVEVYLLKNVLTDYNNVFGEYIKQMVKEEDEKPVLSIVTKTKILKEILLTYEEQKKHILDSIANGFNQNNSSLNDITNLKGELIHLKHMGTTFNNIFASVTNCLEKTHCARRRIIYREKETNTNNIVNNTKT